MSGKSWKPRLPSLDLDLAAELGLGLRLVVADTLEDQQCKGWQYSPALSQSCRHPQDLEAPV